MSRTLACDTKQRQLQTPASSLYLGSPCFQKQEWLDTPLTYLQPRVPARVPACRAGSSHPCFHPQESLGRKLFPVSVLAENDSLIISVYVLMDV